MQTSNATKRSSAAMSASRTSAKSSSTAAKKGGTRAEPVRVVIPPDETLVDEQGQLIFLKTATARAYPHVEGWFHHQADRYTADADELVRAAQKDEDAAVPQHHRKVESSRAALTEAKALASAQQKQQQAVSEYEQCVERAWRAAFQSAAQSYLDELSAMEAMLRDRHFKAILWREKGEKAAVLDRMARFEEKRRALAARADREFGQIARARQREQQRIKLAFESCLVEIRDVVAWHTQQPHTPAHINGSVTNASQGSEEMALRRRQLLVMLGGTAAVRQYLEARQFAPPSTALGTHPSGAGAGVADDVRSPPALVSPNTALTGILRRRTSESPKGTPTAAEVSPEQLTASWLWRLIQAEEAQEATRAGSSSSSTKLAGRRRQPPGAVTDTRKRPGPRAPTTGADARHVGLSREEARLESHAQALQAALRTHLSEQRARPPRGSRLRQGQGITKADEPAEREEGEDVSAHRTPSVNSDGDDGFADPNGTADEQQGGVHESAANADAEPRSPLSDDTSTVDVSALGQVNHTAALHRALEKVEQDLQLPHLECDPTAEGCVRQSAPASAAGVKRGPAQNKPKVAASFGGVPPVRLTHAPPGLPSVKAGASSLVNRSPRPAGTFARLPQLPTPPQAALRSQPTRPNASSSPPMRRDLVVPSLAASAVSFASTASGALPDPAAEVPLEALSQLVEALQTEKAESRALVETSAVESLHWLDRLESLKASSAQVALENVALEQRRRALTSGAGSGTSARKVVDGAAPAETGGVHHEAIEWVGQGLPWATPTSPSSALTVKDATLADRDDLRAALHERQAQVAQLHSAIDTLARRVQHDDDVLEAAALYWRQNASALRQPFTSAGGSADGSRAVDSTAVGIPALGLESAEEVAEFIANLF